MRTIYLVACSGTKATGPCEARDLYQGDLFKRARRYVEALGAVPGLKRAELFDANQGRRPMPEGPWWFILSAKHGLVSPDAVIDPYDQRMPSRVADREAWAAGVMCRIPGLGKGDRVVILAGRDYRTHLVDQIEGWGATVEVPLEGLGIGLQRKRLGELVAELGAPVRRWARDLFGAARRPVQLALNLGGAS